MRNAKEQALVSVIVPVYNTEKYVREALNSVIAQTYSNLEILVIDDGSTDGSGAICDEFQRRDPRVRVVHQENRGLSGARNTGLRLMRGEFVAFLDSDDRYYSKMIETMIRSMEKSGSEISECRVLNAAAQTKQRTPVSEGVFSAKEIFHLIMKRQANCYVWDKVYRSELWQGVRFPEGHYYEDMAVILDILFRAERICLIRDKLVYYRNRPNSITKDVSETNTRDYIWGTMKLSRFVEAHRELFSDDEDNEIKRYVLRKFLGRYNHVYRLDADRSVKSRAVLRAAILKLRKSIPQLSFPERAAVSAIRVCPNFVPYLGDTYRKLRGR